MGGKWKVGENLPPLRKQKLSKKSQEKGGKIKEPTDLQLWFEFLWIPDMLEYGWVG